jgi:hypothetical protein
MESVGRTFPSIPELGQEDTHYGKIAHKAEKSGDLYTRSVYKIAQYLTLALNPDHPWPEKLKYFRHALEKHAKPVPPIDDDVWNFYQGLEGWVRTICGAEALRLIEREDEFFVERANQHEVRFRIVSDAARFFPQFVPAECPEWFTAEDYEKMRSIQMKWA